MGGIATDLSGRASLPGLWAVGETARTGVHGANRLASNSLLEGAVFGKRAALDIAASPGTVVDAGVLDAAVLPGTTPDPQPDVVAALRDLMWDRVGLARDHDGLVLALDEIDRLEEKVQGGGVSEIGNMLAAARMIAASALLRTESRGGHFRTDYPETVRWWNRPIVVNP
jgi:L-aspartate oxidase